MAQQPLITLEIPLNQGMSQKFDDRALPQPKLSDCQNAVFAKFGGQQKRNGTAALGLSIYGGGSITAADMRKVVAYRDELLLFTKDTIYSYLSNQSSWVSRGNYYAVKTEEKVIAGKTAQQYAFDRVEKGNVLFVAWYDTDTSSAHVSAVDTTTGAYLVRDQSLGTSTTRPRLLALANKVVVVFYAGGNVIKALSVTPATASTDLAAAATTLVSNAEGRFDICANGANSATDRFSMAYVNTTAGPQYSVGTWTDGLSVIVAATAKARTAVASAIAIAYGSGPNRLAVIRESSATTVVADILFATQASALGDVSTSTTVFGTSFSDGVLQLSAVWKTSTDDGAYRCFVFASAEMGGGEWDVFSNWVNSAAAVGTVCQVALASNLASHAFLYDGVPHINLVAVGIPSGPSQIRLQQTYLLYSYNGTPLDSTNNYGGTIKGQAVKNTAPDTDVVYGHLSGVQNTSGSTYAWCGGSNYRLTTANGRNKYSEAVPVDIKHTFDSNDARRCVEYGKTLYVTGSIPCQYDGARLSEIGYMFFPETFTASQTTTGSLTQTTTYGYRILAERRNAVGEKTISASAAISSITLTGTNDEIALSIRGIQHSFGGYLDDSSLPVYRTLSNGVALYYRASDPDPSASGANGYVENVPSSAAITFTDRIADTSLDDLEQDYLSFGEVENISPPPATIIHKAHGRLILAGIAGDPNAIWYSKQKVDGRCAEFYDGFVIYVPEDGGEITALATLNESIVVFKKTSIWIIQGRGPNNTFTDGGYSDPVKINSFIGATSADLVAETPIGVFFKSRVGLRLLDQAYQVQYVGADVEDEISNNTYVAITAVPDYPQIRLLSSTTDKTLVFDYEAGQWSTWTIDGLSACIYSNTYYYIDTATPRYESAGTYVDGSSGYSLLMKTGWIRFDGKWSRHRLQRILFLGEYKSAHKLEIKLAFNGDPTFVQTETWTASPTVAGEAERVRIRPNVKKVEAVMIQIKDLDTSGGVSSLAQGFDATSLVFEFVPETGIARLSSDQSV